MLSSSKKIAPRFLGMPSRNIEEFYFRLWAVPCGRKEIIATAGSSSAPEFVGSTVARWIKSLMSQAGVDTVVYSAHSTRGASASNAANLGLPTDAIYILHNSRVTEIGFRVEIFRRV